MNRRFIFILSALLVAGVVYASGTPNLPQNFSIRGQQVSRRDLQYGQQNFTGRKLVGEGGKACANCHDNPKKLEARSLNRQVQKLPELINKCLTHRERSRGKELKPDSKEMIALEAWLIYRYRLRLPRQ